MPGKKPKLKVVSRNSATAARQPEKSPPGRETAPEAPVTVSGRWIAAAVAGVMAASALCVWVGLCLLFWQGSWQLLYHPSATVARTPAAAGLPFDSIGFAASGSGVPGLYGWWIAAAPGSRLGGCTVLYFHGPDGNLGDTVDHLAQLHSAGVNVFAFDYRGYGQSHFAHPSERRWLEDADSALDYLTATRHIDPGSIVPVGSSLGANLALEFAAAHPQFAGVVLESPLEDPVQRIFADARARLVPARLLVSDRYDLADDAAALRIPSLWFLPFPKPPGDKGLPDNPEAFQKVSAPKMFVWLPPGQSSTKNYADEFSRWLDDVHSH